MDLVASSWINSTKLVLAWKWCVKSIGYRPDHYRTLSSGGRETRSCPNQTHPLDKGMDFSSRIPQQQAIAVELLSSSNFLPGEFAMFPQLLLGSPAAFEKRTFHSVNRHDMQTFPPQICPGASLKYCLCYLAALWKKIKALTSGLYVHFLQPWKCPKIPTSCSVFRNGCTFGLGPLQCKIAKNGHT